MYYLIFLLTIDALIKNQLVSIFEPLTFRTVGRHATNSAMLPSFFFNSDHFQKYQHQCNNKYQVQVNNHHEANCKTFLNLEKFNAKSSHSLHIVVVLTFCGAFKCDLEPSRPEPVNFISPINPLTEQKQHILQFYILVNHANGMWSLHLIMFTKKGFLFL